MQKIPLSLIGLTEIEVEQSREQYRINRLETKGQKNLLIIFYLLLLTSLSVTPSLNPILH
jgi:hypothetical protein